ncbi:glycosyltransferase [Neolewinella litorea]|uniref:Glycosyltransferase family 1 protein n=1 Tax=Neolewinella litorea TaxID=2562452 RepID=A0A4S4N622_9BACT|nr:glycosyltransferase [Neolewinella litorea]THH34564.1 glycosyltransferase family 1 protein [Neolewinella litorea]
MKHLLELVNSKINVRQFGFDRVVLFTSLIDIGEKILNEDVDVVILPRGSNPISNFLIQKGALKKAITDSACDIIFCPGGTVPPIDLPYVSMSQNMLVFEKKERNRFPWGPLRWRYQFLHFLQSRSLLRATGNIFISDYAKEYICTLLPALTNLPSRVIPLGASMKFKKVPRTQLSIEDKLSVSGTFTLTYVSIVNYYKHQWNVVEAVAQLRAAGYPVTLKLVGPVINDVVKRLAQATVGREDFVEYLGAVPYEEIEDIYHNTDLFIFASSCENMPNVLVEAMSAGLPIASSSYGPMPEVLKDGGHYFDPLDINDIASAIKYLLENASERMVLSERAYRYAQAYTWRECSEQTFTFLSEILRKKGQTTKPQ